MALLFSVHFYFCQILCFYLVTRGSILVIGNVRRSRKLGVFFTTEGRVPFEPGCYPLKQNI